jgi:hypothetical protein
MVETCRTNGFIHVGNASSLLKGYVGLPTLFLKCEIIMVNVPRLFVDIFPEPSQVAQSHRYKGNDEIFHDYYLDEENLCHRQRPGVSSGFIFI